jgi:hypothetical protein
VGGLSQRPPGGVDRRSRWTKAWHGLTEVDDVVTLPPEPRGFLIERVERRNDEAADARGDALHQADYMWRGLCTLPSIRR